MFLPLFLRAAEPVEVLVQGAERLEVGEIVAALEQPQKLMIGPFSFWTGRIGGHRIAVQLTGQALLNCTTSTILGIEEFSPKLIINQGTSGAQAPYLTVHDIIVGQRALDYSGFVTPVRAAGQGSMPLSWTPVPQRLRDPATGKLVTYPDGFAGDPAALAIALRTRNSMGRVFAGVIGSANEVNLELDRVRWSHQVFGMDVEEMESGVVAAVAHAYGIRYIAFRVVSDAPYEGVQFIPRPRAPPGCSPCGSWKICSRCEAGRTRECFQTPDWGTTKGFRQRRNLRSPFRLIAFTNRFRSR